MLSKKSNGHKKPCESQNRHASSYLLTKSDRSVYRVTPKASVTSKKMSSKESKVIHPEGNFHKRCPVAKPKKTTRSEYCFTRKVLLNNKIDYCSECGDVVGPIPNYESPPKNKNSTTNIPTKPEKHIIVSMPVENKTVNAIKSNSTTPLVSPVNSVHGRIKINFNGRSGMMKEKGDIAKQPVEQYYKNENFIRKSDSAYDMTNMPKKLSSLDTIKELPEKITEDTSIEGSVFQVFTDSEEFIPIEGKTNVKNLTEFRNDNYFECHSANNRLKSEVSATKLGPHKCAYRFYLNDRLFPVPLYADRDETIRCTECHLPLKIDEQSKKDDIDGIIQAKVKIGPGEDVQDMLLMLPVKEPLIIKERRLNRNEDKDEVVYFGVVKLTRSGDSLFSRNFPRDSLALRYQKGYTEYNCSDKDLKFDRVSGGDVIVI